MRMFFAGAENNKIRKWLKEAGVEKILISYHYMIERGVNVKNVLKDFPYVIIDSGAFTLYQVLFKNREKINYEKYMNKYLDFLYKYKGKFFFAANFDLDIVLGTDLINEWNKYFEELEEKHGQRICYVVHDDTLPYRNLYRYFEKYNYIGVSGGYYGKDDVGYFSQVYNLSLMKRKYVHGFGLTNFVMMSQFPFYSADSTTYLGGARYGSTYVFNGSYFETWDYFQKYRRKILKHWCEKWDIDYKGLINDDVEWVTKFNIKAWLENEKIFNRRTKIKQWWLTPELYYDIGYRNEKIKNMVDKYGN